MLQLQHHMEGEVTGHLPWPGLLTLKLVASRSWLLVNPLQMATYSGGANDNVPSSFKGCLFTTRSCPRRMALPKSPNFHSPLLVRNTFSLFTSRWTIP